MPGKIPKKTGLSSKHNDYIVGHGAQCCVDGPETLAKSYGQAGRFDDAVATLGGLLKSHGSHSMAYPQLGRICQEMAKTEEAKEALDAILSPDSHLNIGT